MTSLSKVTQLLAATLSPDGNTRISAELKLAEYMASSEAGLALSQITLSQDIEPALRQMTSIVLRKYVRERWSPYFTTFRGSAPPVEVKAQIRAAVFQGLSDPVRKIRTSCAHTLSSIANCDWPDEYSDLLSNLINLLSSGSADSIHGAMQVFTEFIRTDLSEEQILPVLRQLLPALLAILGAAERHSALTRARAVAVFRECVSALYMVKEQHPQATQEATASVLPIWLEAFKVLLASDPRQDIVSETNWDGLAIRIQIFRALDTIHTSFPRSLRPYLSEYLNSALGHLQALYPTFVAFYLSDDASVPLSSEDEPIELPHLICPIIDFSASIARSGKAKEWFDQSNTQALVDTVFRWVQMTKDDEENWANNANAFVAEEDDETSAYSIRVAGFDLLSSILERSPVATSSSFASSIQRTASESQRAREMNSSEWWRPLEAALAAVGSQSETVIECLEDEELAGRTKPIDIASLLTNVIPSVLTLHDFPFLQGRGFVFASQYGTLLPKELAGQYLDAAIQVVEANVAGVPIKVSAIKAIQNFCQNVDDAVLLPFAPRMAQDIGPFMLVTSEDTLALVLDTLSVVMQIEKASWLTVELASSLVKALLQVWSQHNKDPMFTSVLSDVLESLASSVVPGVYEVVVKEALPALSNAVSAAKPDELWIPESGIEMITSLIEGASPGKLGDGFFAAIAPTLFGALKSSDDRDVLQNGCQCLTLVVRKDCSQLLAFNDGHSGLEHTFAIIARLLQNEDESGGLFIGELIIHLLRNAGESVLPALPELLQAMLQRMQTAKTASFTQSLIIPFAFLIHNQRDTVLDMLENTSIDGRSGLDVLIQTWCENAETFQGFWQTRVSNLALCSLYVSERPSLRNIVVKGDIIVKPETKNVIMTRSRTKSMPTEFTSIHFPVKAFKIIVRDLLSGGESATLNAGTDNIEEVDSEDGDEGWEEESHHGFKREEYAMLSEMLGPRGLAFDNDDILDGPEDEDLRNDPISQMDMQAHLVSFIKECASRNTNDFQNVVGQLNAEEMSVVQRVLT
ncbi:ARM repeat-containing protein [Punctularia strigosozonata HHB-11173 SS5]|uniref:ARM repeat-containing protein n=1 Tax=Punctularia strigosozonata (strain HHB-11173) TaxID=741275 RepID=UPI0004416C1A|nr:ARM repeat-containing protein [Punctularia strigosozonata HHB-11173 SS5]EIN14253.1 ARM repeat-containing protein [Punctularia strigosozonata HHB-11173 SS5]